MSEAEAGVFDEVLSPKKSDAPLCRGAMPQDHTVDHAWGE